jgi:hypothetical protein
MRQVSRNSNQKHWLVLGMMVVAWASWRCRASRRRQWRRISFLIDEELQSRYRELADSELGTGLFI